MRGMRGFLAGTALALAFSGTAMAAEPEEDELLDGIKIGMLVYDPDDAQTKTFREYLENYLGEAFGASFFYSEAANTPEEETAFIEQLHEQGIQGVIGNLCEEAMELCEEYGIYYVFGAATVADEEFEEIKDNAHFLGTISASLDAEMEAGGEMAGFFAEDGREASHGFVICTGGDNELHRMRSQAMIEKLEDSYGLMLEKTAGELAETEEAVELETGADVKIALVPGYPEITPLAENVQEILEKGGYDTVMSVMSVNSIMDAVRSAETTVGADIRVGTIDCFTEEAQELFQTEDAFGNSQINYLAGKNGGMIAPSFAAMCNAYAGNLDVIRDGGHAFRLYQDYWIATGREEFEQLYDQAVSLYDNAYSAVDIMKVISAFNPDATFESFREFTERNTAE